MNLSVRILGRELLTISTDDATEAGGVNAAPGDYLSTEDVPTTFGFLPPSVTPCEFE